MEIADLQRFKETMDTETSRDNPIITQGLSTMPGNRPKPRSDIPVFRPEPRPQMAMAPQSGQMPVAQQPRPQMPVAPSTEEESPLREMLLKISPLIIAKLGDDALTLFGEEVPAKKEFEIQKDRNENQPDPMQIALSGIQEFGVPACFGPS